MAIAYAVLNGGSVFAKDEKGHTIFIQTGVDQVLGNTSTTVTVKKGNTIVVFDERGKTISTRQA